ncbi:hypothetical protein EDC56_2963 [Sinobacterium caligoides]|uniref:MOSC domain-containing protein n=1 Tax=Sinobacterium caligoides TaxID=933926 RepID=A0A3N2DKJ5_9GAMM|nr:MOSC N-terminal beta barrel domain-containing protein [Sinobacterium caligoides]ROS00317.1 hypothetical protein EDC56_2963 [Sinobacterium caligoides]
MMADVIVSELYIHPVKSLRGIAVDSIELDKFGAKYDRRWMVVDPDGQFITQRQHSEMTKISTAIEDGQLTLRDDNGEIQVAEANANVEMQVKVWGDTVIAQDCGDEVAQWLEQRLAVVCRLVYIADHIDRIVAPAYSDGQQTVGFADGFPLMVISQASLDDLNGRLEEKVTMSRFRPNIVVGGCEPFAEDSWSSLKHERVNFTVAKPCSRCSIPSLDPLTGERHATLNRVLASYRRRDRAIYFGQNLTFDALTKIQRGDRLVVSTVDSELS